MSLNEIIRELESNGIQPKLKKLRGASTHHRRSLWGVKSRVSGKNRRGQIAHGVGSMDNNQLMDGNGCMKP